MTSGETLEAITRPTLVVDRQRAKRNLARMAAKATASGTRFRPHVKTHQSPAIASWYREVGVTAITVSSVEMAERFAAHGWDDITIAFGFNPREGAALRSLARRVRLGLLVDSLESTALLRSTGIAADVWLDVDVGYRRTGVPFDDEQRLLSLASALLDAGPLLRFAGLLTHAGHTYAARTRPAVLALHEEAVGRIRTSQAMLHAHGITAAISIGDTPGCSVATRFDGIDEIRPGNFVLYDLQQLQTGCCSEEDLALAIACPVVGRYPARGAVVIHGGTAHFSRDSADGPLGPVYGRPSVLSDTGWRLADPGIFLSSLAQEHGTLSCSSTFSDAHPPGSLALVVPAHACLACASTRTFVALDGNPL